MKTPSGSSVDRDTLEKACSGDVGAFRRLYDAHAPNVYRYGMLQTGNRQAAEDILQETMIALWRSREKLSEIASISSWIMAVARNKTIDYIRKKAPTVPISEFDDDWRLHGPAAATEALTSDMAGARLQAGGTGVGLPEEAISDRIDITAALLELDPEKRELFYMVFYLDMSYTEIAGAIGIPVGTVKSRMYHARRELKEILERGRKSCADANQ